MSPTIHGCRAAMLALGALLAAAGCMPDGGVVPLAGGKGGSGGDAGTTGGSGTTGSGGSAGSDAPGGTGGDGAGGTAGASGAAGGGASGSGGANAGSGGGGGGASGRGGAGGAAGGASGRGGGGAGGGSGGGGAGGRGGSAGGAAGTNGGAGIGGGSLCTAGRYLLCEGFEGVNVGNNTPSGWSRTGNATVADDQAARGAHALKLTPAADKGYGFYTFGNAESFPAAHWGRVFYRVQTPPPDAFVHASIAAYQGDGPEIGASTFRVVDTVKMAAPTSTHQFLYNVQITGGSEFSKQGPYNWMFDGAWHCAEWFVDGANQAYQFYFDGAEVTQMRIMNGAGNYGSGSNKTNLPMMFNDFRVGFITYQNAPPGFTAWVDEVAIDAQRIGCGN
ncbi:MAG TPA: hypothetical protein VIQ54_24545 [Polyangia bacterium]